MVTLWIWPLVYILYLFACFNLWWDAPLASVLVIVLALVAFLGLMNSHDTVFRFARPRKNNVNAFQVYWKILKTFSDSTEFMAIFILLPLLFGAGFIFSELWGHTAHLPHFHVPWAPVLTIIGIMTAANNAMSEILEKVSVIEKKFWKKVTLIFLSLLSSLTGEPANAAIQNKYLIWRLPKDSKQKTEVGVGVAATIWSWWGLTFFSPPAVIIIWSVMTGVFNWGLGTLILGVGLIVTLHVIVCVNIYAKYIDEKWDAEVVPLEKGSQISWDYTRSKSSLFILIAVIIGHIFIALPMSEAFNPLAKYIVYWADVLLAFYAFGIGLLGQQDKVFNFHKFEHDIQPLLIWGLLIAIDNIGILAEPSIVWFGSILPLAWIPAAILPLVLALSLFVITWVVSALADNALATKVFISLPITIAIWLIANGTSPDQAALVANAWALGVIVWALTFGWITVQWNLPNFPIRSAYDIDPIDWLKIGFPKYAWTLLAPVIGIVVVVLFILPSIISPLNLESYGEGSKDSHEEVSYQGDSH